MQFKKYFFFLVMVFIGVNATAQTKNITVWLTNADRSAVFQKQDNVLSFNKITTSNQQIFVDDSKKFQHMDGFGFALTGGSAEAIVHMSSEARKALLHKAFDTTENNIGVSYLRLSIGSSDLNDHVFSYDDVDNDTTLSHFDLAEDKDDVIPVMKEILSINPHIKILSSPWSPPAWMKTNHDTRGGRLVPEFYELYAKYLMKYIQQMKQHGITIDAITLQNEPLRRLKKNL